MKIVIDARMYGTEYTGIGRYTRNLIENLEKIDHKNEYKILLRRKYFEKLRLNSNFEKVLADFDHYSFSEQIRLPLLLNRLSPELVHFPHFNVPILYKGNFVVTIHDVIMNKQKGKNATSRKSYFYSLKKLGYKIAFSFALERSTSLIVPSKFSKSEIIKYKNVLAEKVNVVYEGVDNNVKPIKAKLTEYKYKFSKIISGKYFIFAGNAYPHKNINRLVEAIKYLSEEYTEEVKLVIVTPKNVFRERLLNFAKNIKAEHLIVFTNFLSDDELGYLYSKSVGFVYPTLEEGFGLPGLEAILNQTLLLASDIEVLREVYKDNAIFFNPYDFSSIQKAMFDVLNLTAEKRQDLIQNSQKVFESYNLEKMAAQTLKIYESCSRI